MIGGPSEIGNVTAGTLGVLVGLIIGRIWQWVKDVRFFLVTTGRRATQ